jgi:3-isopropylmalate/(R)-2-methylmalate dehydratase large subunit
MSMTMSQKILAAHARLDEVRPGQLIMADLDLVLGNDITAPVCSTRARLPWFPTISPRTKT